MFASFVIVALVTFASLLGLLTSWPYQQETQNWGLQARGQDVGNLIAVVVLVVSTIRMRNAFRSSTPTITGTSLTRASAVSTRKASLRSFPALP